MKPFLYYVARDLVSRYGNNLSQVTIVFPGKRAELYMNSFLSHFAQGPVWAPRFRTIDELFQQMTDLTESDNILNVCRLYRIYAQLLGDEAESLDEFYGWGEILMNDFNDIDKHLVDADSLFANAGDLTRLEATDYLSKEQIAALQKFFSNFDPEHQTLLKERFVRMWGAMPEMYRRLKAELRSEGLMYKGALYREVAEKVKREGLMRNGAKPGGKDASGSAASLVEESNPSPIYCFVGFNVLDDVEEALFAALRDSGQALFYWDYDTYYAAPDSDHEAGRFLRHNLAKFPCALPEEAETEIFQNLLSPDNLPSSLAGRGKQIRILSASTDNAQVRYLPQWLATLSEADRQSAAIVLCDEALMRPAMHSLPQETEVNITMGYPLTDTAIHGYISALIDLQVDGYNEELGHFLPTALERVEKNPFFATFPQELRPLAHTTDTTALIDWLIAVTEHLGQSLSQTESPSPYNQLYAEATFQLYRILNQFRWLVADGTLSVLPNTLRRLIRQALLSASIPFHGDMDQGVQVMGLLEARNLDFRHLIMLSVGEGILPRRSSDTSLIPYILRAHFGLDTVERQDSVYAYSFYRLLQRAEDITLVYNGNSSGATQREQSRFLRQLLTETTLPITQGKLEAPFSVRPAKSLTREKDTRIMQILREKPALSPTAINQYIECPMRFYFQQVAHLRMPDRPQDGIDNARFGTIFHDTCETFYRHLIHITGRRQVLRSDLQPLFGRQSSSVPLYVDLVFWVDFFHGLEYDSFTHAKEREDFLRPFLAAPDQPTFCKQVLQLYGGHAEARDRYFTGINMIIRSVIIRLVNQLLRWDMEHAPFTLYGMEVDRYTQFTVPSGDQEVTLRVGGRIDRMDIMTLDGCPTLRVEDYKTGKAKSGPTTLEAIFDASGHNAHGYYLQTFLYSLIMSQEQPDMPVSPCLFYVLSATDPIAYSPTLRLGKETVTDIRTFATEYAESLRRVLAEIYDPTRPFVQTQDEQGACKFCDFRRLCGR
ncbi:MAG: PD-(D/E)XK nuclease family protein [Bacteroidaceae bacterium]|nr:PD-(D/E)XK nuclease family protein [Bacteroidaceae bacterium]